MRSLCRSGSTSPSKKAFRSPGGSSSRSAMALPMEMWERHFIGCDRWAAPYLIFEGGWKGRQGHFPGKKRKRTVRFEVLKPSSWAPPSSPVSLPSVNHLRSPMGLRVLMYLKYISTFAVPDINYHHLNINCLKSNFYAVNMLRRGGRATIGYKMPFRDRPESTDAVIRRTNGGSGACLGKMLIEHHRLEAPLGWAAFRRVCTCSRPSPERGMRSFGPSC